MSAAAVAEAETLPKIDKASDVGSIVFVGNCQARLLFSLYKQFSPAAPRQRIAAVMSYVNLSEPDRAAIQNADLIVQQVQNFASKVDWGGVQTNATRILLPVVHCGFLWPFAGQAHPNNPSPAYFEGGPYGAEASDAWLNRMIKKAVDPETAVAQYLELDVNAVVNLDRLYEVTIQKQRERDKLTGFDIAEIISKHFRDEPVFRTPYHPDLRVTMALATQLFERLGVPVDDIERMRRIIRVSPFPATELPIHPAVCRHFGLRFVTEDRRWQFMREGRFTFREFALRYMTGTWNEALEEASHLAGQGHYREAHKRIADALEMSPALPMAHGIKAHILSQLGDLDEAITAARRAVSIEPDNAAHRARLGSLLNRKGNKAGAEAELRAATELDRFESHYALLLAGLLREDGRLDAAASMLRGAIAISPYSSRLHDALGSVLERIGDRAGAAEVLHRAGEVDPNNAEAANAHARLLLSSGHIDAAIAEWQRAVGLGCVDKRAYRELVRLLIQAGDLDAAQAVARRATERFPEDDDLDAELAAALDGGNTSSTATAARIGRDETPTVAPARPERARRLNSQQIRMLRGTQALDEIYNPRPPKVILERGQRDRLYDIVRERLGDCALTYLEFGVYRGWSIAAIAKKFGSPDARFVGFDSFEGLPERWSADHAAGHFATGGAATTSSDGRVRFIEGWFQNTVPDFLQSHRIAGPVLVNFDSELYSSTLFLLTTLWHHLPEYYFVFDEFYPDEASATMDFLSAYPAGIEFYASVNSIAGRPVQTFGRLKRTVYAPPRADV
jgi:Flp pilus assembly protein TadD